MTVQNFNSDPDIQQRWWEMKRTVHKECVDAAPNPAHYLFGKLEHAGKLGAVVTQNIDSMHKKGGVSEDKVIELHGDMRRIICSNHKTPLNPLPFRSGGCVFTCSWGEVESEKIYVQA